MTDWTYEWLNELEAKVAKENAKNLQRTAAAALRYVFTATKKY